MFKFLFPHTDTFRFLNISGLFCNFHLTGHPSELYNPSESQILYPKFHVSNIYLEGLLVIISISEFP